MQDQRNDRGVRVRADGKGDGWANAHRQAHPKYYMQDIDAVFGAQVFGANTGERLFLEYVPDNYENSKNGSSVREFAVVAMFDRKANWDAAFKHNSKVSTAFYLWMCRILGERQAHTPRFFYVIGTQYPPWHMVEIDIQTGEQNGKPVPVSSGNMDDVWMALGLDRLRNEMAKIVDPKGHW